VVAEDVPTPNDLDGAFQALARHRVDVLIVLQTSMLVSERRKIAALAGTAKAAAKPCKVRPAGSPACVPAAA